MNEYKFTIINKDFKFKNNLSEELENCYSIVAKCKKEFNPLSRVIGMTNEVLVDWAKLYNGYSTMKNYTYFVEVCFIHKEEAEKFLSEVIMPRYERYKTTNYPDMDTLKDSSLPLDYLKSDYHVEIGALKEIKGLAKIINAQYNKRDFAHIYVEKIVGNRVALVDSDRSINLTIGVDQWTFKEWAEQHGARWIRYCYPAYEFKTFEEADKFLTEVVLPRWEEYKKTNQRIFRESCKCVP